MKPSLRVGRIAGLEIGVHYTLVFALALIVLSLAEGFFPNYFSGWATTTYWATGLLAALLLFASVLVHELAHSLVAQARGLPVRGITLFIFGGVSNLQGEPQRARDEFIIAIVGPLTSLLLAVVFGVLWALASGQQEPLEATLFYLALVNALLGIFNLVPGFPLDGGRVLRSVLWAATGSIIKATNIAAAIGQGVGYTLIALGILQVLMGFFEGLWMALIGWFLSSAAGSSRRQTLVQSAFQSVPVSAVMDASPHAIEPQVSVQSLVHDHLLRLGIRACPVQDEGRLVGIVTFTDIKGTPQERWPTTPVEATMTREPLHQVGPNTEVAEALRLLETWSLNQVLVTDEGKLVGLISRADITRYLQLRLELGLKGTAHGP